MTSNCCQVSTSTDLIATIEYGGSGVPEPCCLYNNLEVPLQWVPELTPCGGSTMPPGWEGTLAVGCGDDPEQTVVRVTIVVPPSGCWEDGASIGVCCDTINGTCCGGEGEPATVISCDPLEVTFQVPYVVGCCSDVGGAELKVTITEAP